MSQNNRIRFNKKTVESLPVPDSGRKYYYDTQISGLAICVTNRDVKTYYVIKRINNRPTRYRLGKIQELTVEQARNKAMEVLSEIASGIDPQRERNMKRKGVTMKDVFDHWMDYSKAHKKTWKEDQRVISKYFSQWDSRRIEEWPGGPGGLLPQGSHRPVRAGITAYGS